MSHRKAQIYNIGKRIYGSDPKKQRDKWIKDGTKEYLVRVTACLKDNASVTQSIRDDLSHVEGCIAGSKTTKHKMFKPKTVAPSDTAVRAHLEQLV